MELVFTDPLTGLPTRHALERSLEFALLQTRRDRSSLCAIACDLDFFAAFNERYGAAAGDDCLRYVARTLGSSIGTNDMLGRLGGDRFLAILPNTDLRTATGMAERLRVAVTMLDIPVAGAGTVAVSISAGVAQHGSGGGDFAAAMLEELHETMRDAKRSGRNCVVIAGQGLDLAYDVRALRERNAAALSDPGPLFGRDADVGDILEVLRRHSMVTLVGGRGSGKTRLARAVTQRACDEFQDGSFFIDLSELNAEATAVDVAHRFGIRQRDDASAIRSLSTLLRLQQTILIVDGCDLLPDAVAVLFEKLLAACPHLRVLATGHRATGLTGEACYPIEPLSERAARELCDAIAGEEEANAPRAALLERCGGNALALEMAAAHLRVFSPSEIAAAMRDESHPPLDALIAWSYARLTEPQRRLLRGLSVFADGWSTDDVAAVAEVDPLAAREELDVLARRRLVLLDATRARRGRYRFRSAVRSFVHDAITASGEEESTRHRHALRFASLANTIAASWSTAPTRTWLPPLERELSNLLQALRWSLDRDDDPSLAAQIACGLAPYWTAIEDDVTGAAVFSRVLERPPSDTALYGNVLDWAARFSQRTGASLEAMERADVAMKLATERGDDLLYARALSSHAFARFAREDQRADGALPEALATLDVFERVGNALGQAQTHLVLGIFYHSAENVEQAQEHYAEALRRFRNLGVESGMQVALNNLGALAFLRRDFDRAAFFLHESLVRADRHPHKRGLGYALLNQGEDELERGNLEAARRLLARARRFYSIVPNDWAFAMTLTDVAKLALRSERPKLAPVLLGFADAVFARIAIPRQPFQQRLYDELFVQARAMVEQRDFDALYARGQGLVLEQALLLADSA